MSITLSPAKARYLEQVRTHLSDLPEEEREEIVQDLESHLAELDDSRIEAELGDPEAFAAEFRSSAGLDEPRNRQVWDAIPRIWSRLEASADSIGQLVRWPSIRPVWIWMRGWLVVCAWALLYTGQSFRRFPIPIIENSSWAGLIVVVAATAFSVWLDRRPQTRWRRFGTATFSFVAGWALLGTLMNPPYANTEVEAIYPPFDRMTTADGEPVNNIYAYDLEGNPVAVLLFDSEGQPLLTLPPYTYDDAENFPSDAPYDFGEGVVRFERDIYGQIIPNLYPLDLSVYDNEGRLNPLPPPSLGFPALEEDQGATPMPSVQ